MVHDSTIVYKSSLQVDHNETVSVYRFDVIINNRFPNEVILKIFQKSDISTQSVIRYNRTFGVIQAILGLDDTEQLTIFH